METGGTRYALALATDPDGGLLVVWPLRPALLRVVHGRPTWLVPVRSRADREVLETLGRVLDSPEAVAHPGDLPTLLRQSLRSPATVRVLP